MTDFSEASYGDIIIYHPFASFALTGPAPSFDQLHLLWQIWSPVLSPMLSETSPLCEDLGGRRASTWAERLVGVASLDTSCNISEDCRR